MLPPKENTTGPRFDGEEQVSILVKSMGQGGYIIQDTTMTSLGADLWAAVSAPPDYYVNPADLAVIANHTPNLAQNFSASATPIIDLGPGPVEPKARRSTSIPGGTDPA